jgi:hypothetical protein
MGSNKGGTVVTITGAGFSTTLANNQVLIDEIQCVISAATATSITCTTGPRPNLTKPSLVV